MEFFRTAGLMARNVSTEVVRHFDRKRLLVNQLKAQHVNVVFDVGANWGQFGTALRRAGYKGRIVSFEPLSEPFAHLKKKSAADALWECQQLALGDTEKKIAINIAGNAGASSSVLPMLKSHQEAFPPANYIGTEDVLMRRLDSVTAEVLNPTDVAFLKVDVQGFEKHVIEGGMSTINDRCAGMQLELSFLPLYDGDMLIQEALELVYSLGFRLTGLLPGFSDPRNGRMLQADGIFFRGDD